MSNQDRASRNPSDIIADSIRQQIETGELTLENIPSTLARYGLMQPQDFVNEMNKKMGCNMDIPDAMSPEQALEFKIIRMLEDLMCHDMTDAVIRSTQTLRELNMDELDLTEFSMMLEDEFGLVIPDDFKGDDTVEDVCKYLERRKVKV